jgi:hypothetical protein
MAVKQVYVTGFGLVEVPSELQGDELVRYANAEADRLSTAAPTAPAPSQEKPSPGLLSQAGAFLGSIPEGIAQGVGTTVSGIGALTTIDALKQAGEGISQFGTDISKELLDEEQRQSMGGAGGRLVGNIATYLGPGIVAKGLGLGGRGALALSSALSGVGGAGEQSQKIAEARKEGKDISEAQEFGLSAAAGVGTAALEALPVGKFLNLPGLRNVPLIGKLLAEGLDPKVVKEIEQRFAGAAGKDALIADALLEADAARRARMGLTGYAGAAIKGGVVEAPVEGAQNTLQNFLANYGYNPEQQITEGLKESLIAGGLGGSAIQGGIEIFQAKQAKAGLESARARAVREQSAPPVTPETAAQTTLFVDPLTGKSRVVDRKTPKEKETQKIAESIVQGGEVPSGVAGLLPEGGPVMRFDTEVGTIEVPSSFTAEDINKRIEEIKQGRRERQEAGEAAGRLFIQSDLEKQQAGFQKQLPPGGDFTQVETKTGRVLMLPAGSTQEQIDQADQQLQELDEQNERSAEASRRLYEKAQEVKAKKDLKDAKAFAKANPDVAQSVFSQMGIESPESLAPTDIPALVDLMMEETYKRQETLASASQRIESNFSIASDLARTEFKRPLGKLTDTQKIELGSLVDTRLEINKKEYEDAVEEAGIRTAMGVEGSSVEPADVRQRRAAQAVYGKPYEKLSRPGFFPSAVPSTSEQEIVDKAVQEGDIRSLEITPEEILERKQFEGMPFTTTQYREAQDVLKANPDTPITTSLLKKQFDLPTSDALKMISLMQKRGDIVEVDGKNFVEPEAPGPLYQLIKTTPPSGDTTFNLAQETKTQNEFDEKIASQYAPDLVEALKKRKMEDLFLLGITNAIRDAKGDIVPANGQYLDRVIYLATSPDGSVRSKEAMLGTLDHEIIHGMKKLNMFSDAEWRMLTDRFKVSYLGDMEDEYRKHYSGRKDLENLLKEEAIAKAAADLAVKDPQRLDPAAKSLVKKVESFLGFGRTAAQMGYASAEDVLSAIKTGDIGKRRFTPSYETSMGKEVSAPREIRVAPAGKVGEFVPPKTPEPEAPKGKKRGGAKKTKADLMVPQDESAESLYQTAQPSSTQPQAPQVTPGGIVRAFAPPSKEGLVNKIYDFFSVDRKGSFRQKFLDRYDPIKEYAIKAYQQTGDSKYLAAASGAYQGLLFSDKAQDVAMAGLQYGGFSYDGRIFTAEENPENSPIQIFNKLASMPASQPGFENKLEEFFEASYAKRYLDLAETQGKDPGGVIDIDDVRRTWDTFKGDADIESAMNRFKAFNDNLIDVLVKSDFISRKMGESWKQAYYIPFYRLPTVKTPDGDVETGEVDAPKVGTKATNLAAAKALSGRNLRVNDAMENIIYNTYFMIGTAMKNVAANRVVRDGLTVGYMKELPVKTDPQNPKVKRRMKEDPGSNVITVRQNGEKKFYQVDDPMVYDAVAKSTIPVQDALKMMGSLTSLLRKGVTLGPAFILRNPVRDTLQVWMQGGLGSNLIPPIGDYKDGIISVIRNSPEFQRLKQAGVSGSGIRQENIKKTAAAIREKIGIGQQDTMQKFLGLLAKPLGLLEKASEASEGISRVQVYKNALEKTGDEAEALFAAMETINFSRRGTSRGAQIAVALLPFFNARLQGLDVFYRTVKGDPMVPKELAPDGARTARIRMAYVAGLSMAYAAAMAGTKAWQNATDEERDNNIFIPVDWIDGVKEGTVLKFPIPQEFGLLTKMLPERLMAWYLQQDDGADVVNAISRSVIGTLKFDLIPQAIRPLYENAANFDFYTQKPIENAYLQRLLPEQRYTEYTSELYKKIAEETGLSPVKLDHLVRGYTGTIGAFTADAIGMTIGYGKGTASPERFSLSEPYLLPAVGQLFKSANGRKAVENLYELDEAATMAVSTLRAVSKGQREMSPEQQEELRSMLYTGKQIAPALKRIERLNKMKRTVMASPDLSAQEKRDQLNSIQEEMVSVASQVKDIKKELPLRFRVGLSRLLGF